MFVKRSIIGNDSALSKKNKELTRGYISLHVMDSVVNTLEDTGDLRAKSRAAQSFIHPQADCNYMTS